jgi:hypothetical protein
MTSEQARKAAHDRENRAELSARHVAWCEANREHIRAYNRAWMRAKRAKEKETAA